MCKIREEKFLDEKRIYIWGQGSYRDSELMIVFDSGLEIITWEISAKKRLQAKPQRTGSIGWVPVLDSRCSLHHPLQTLQGDTSLPGSSQKLVQQHDAHSSWTECNELLDSLTDLASHKPAQNAIQQEIIELLKVVTPKLCSCFNTVFRDGTMCCNTAFHSACVSTWRMLSTLKLIESGNIQLQST